MFSQKKKNHTWIYLCGVLLILILAVFILVGAVISRNSEEEALQANLETRAEEKSQTQDSSAVSAEHSEETQTPEATEDSEQKADAEKDGQVQFYQSYYLVKYDKDGIRIYFSDETGQLTELEKTAIVYETLSEQDQIRFRDGIKVDTRDDLNRLIMDYES